MPCRPVLSPSREGFSPPWPASYKRLHTVNTKQLRGYSSPRLSDMTELAGETLDVDAQRRVQDLVKRATHERQRGLDPDVLRDIKGMCKVDDDNVRTAYSAISVALKSKHSQVRLLAVELADVLFQRSKVFRGLLAPELTSFLAKTVGFRKEDPLPPPAAAAAALRNRALTVLDGWNSKFGSMYHQVALGCSYLKTTLKYNFSNAQANADAAQAEERRAARVSYQQIDREFDSMVSDMDDTVVQLKEALALAEAPARAVDAAEEEERAMGWSDAMPASGQDSDAEGGVSGYGADELEPATLQPHATEAATTPAAPAEDRAADPVLGESIAGCARLLTQRYLPTLRSWLDVFVKVRTGSGSGPPQHQVDARTHSVLQRRGDITRLLAEVGAARVRVPGLAAALDAASVARAPAMSTAAAAASGGGSGRTHRSSSLTPEEEAELLELAQRHAQLRHPADPQGSWTLDQRFEGRRGDTGLTPAQLLLSARPLKAPLSPVGAASPACSGSPATAVAPAADDKCCPEQRRDGTDKDKSALPAHLKWKLLQSAPMVPAGGHLHYWDSGSGSAAAGNSGMEISNHWGAVDRDTRVSLAQLEGMAVNHVAQYYTPEPKSAKAPPVTTQPEAAPVAPAAPEAVTATRKLAAAPGETRIGGGLHSSLSLASRGSSPACAPDREIAALERLLEQQREQEARQKAADEATTKEAAERAAAAAAAATASGADASGHGLVMPSEPSRGEGEAAAREAASARVHQLMAGPRGAAAFNAAILAGAKTDEDVARALGAAAMEEVVASQGRKRKAGKSPAAGAKLKKLLTAKPRLGPKHSIPGKGHAWFR